MEFGFYGRAYVVGRCLYTTRNTTFSDLSSLQVRVAHKASVNNISQSFFETTI